PDDYQRLKVFVSVLQAHRQLAGELNLSTLIDRVITDTRYDCAALSDGQQRFSAVRRLLDVADRFEQQAAGELRGFLSYLGEFTSVSLDDGVGAAQFAGDQGSANGAVQLLTIHRAKGLEFPVVCVADLGRRRPTTKSQLLIDRDQRVGLRFSAASDGFDGGAF